MKNILLILFCALVADVFAQLQADTLHREAGISIRGLVYTKKSGLLAAGSSSFVWDNGHRIPFPHPGKDLRDIHKRPDGSLLLLSAGDSCGLYSANGDCLYMNRDSAFFADDIHFASPGDGLVLCDPMHGLFCFLYTKDGGHSWAMLAMPGVKAGEASFAASGSSLYYQGKQRWLWVSGGPQPSLLQRPKAGIRRMPLPLQAGSPSKGAYSLAVKGKMYVVAGGDYTRPGLSDSTLCYSTGKGKNWHLASGTGGYRSSVIALTKRIWVCTGPSGTDISYNAARSWQPLLKEGFHVLVRETGRSFYAAGSGGRIVRIRL